MDLIFAIITLIIFGTADGRPSTFDNLCPRIDITKAMEPRGNPVLTFRPEFEIAEGIMEKKISKSSPLQCFFEFASASGGNLVHCEEAAHKIEFLSDTVMRSIYHQKIRALRYNCEYFNHSQKSYDLYLS